MSGEVQQYRVSIGQWLCNRLLRNPDALKIDCRGLDLFVVRGVLDDEQCRGLVALIDSNLSPSLVMGATTDPDYRTSQSCTLDMQHPLVLALEQRLNDVIGIQPELGETAQGQRYGPGEQFKPHWDYFVSTEPYWPRQERSGGQRTWTAMLYLNEPEDGGQTIFTEANVTVRPRPGNLLVWNNLDADGNPNPRSMHQGMPVLAGAKYVITKWYRENRWIPVPI
jgi:prolyl 4-hydroxylase